MTTKEKEEAIKQFIDLKESGDLNEYIKDNIQAGQDIGIEADVIELLAYFLWNAHDCISKISSNLCGLGKSTYAPYVYIQEIERQQMELNNSAVYQDIMEIITSKNTNHEKIEEIKEYLDDLEK